MRTAKLFTDEETHEARLTGRFDAPNGIENQARRGRYSGIARRHIATEKALAGSKSVKTIKTAAMNLVDSMNIASEYELDHGLVFAFAKLAKTMSPFDAFVQISERVQRLKMSTYVFEPPEYSGTIYSYKSPSAAFEEICAEVQAFAEQLLAKFNRFFPTCANRSKNPHRGNNEQDLSDASKPNSQCTMDRKPKRHCLPSEIYRLITNMVGNRLQSVDLKQILGKLGACFRANDFQRFNYVLSEAAKGRSIFAKTGKFTQKKKARTHFVDKVAGQRGFLEKFGIAADKNVGLVYA